MGTVLSKKISKPPRKKCTHIPQQCTHPHKCTHRDFLTCVCFHDPFTDFCATRVRQTLWLDLQNDSKNWGRIWTVDSWQGRLVTLSSRRSVSKTDKPCFVSRVEVVGSAKRTKQHCTLGGSRTVQTELLISPQFAAHAVKPTSRPRASPK